MLFSEEEQRERDELAGAVKATPHHPRTDKIGGLRKIVSEKQAARIDGHLVDMATAHVIVTIYDALNEKNKADFASRPVKQMALIAWKVAKR